MEARLIDSLPQGPEWQYEPKWDGFRCLVFRNGQKAFLQSRTGRPLERYFPDILQAVLQLRAKQFVLDGELVVPVKRRLSFEQLQLRLHPAASRVQKLVAEHPAVLVVFDLLAIGSKSLVNLPLAERRPQLEDFAGRFLLQNQAVRLSPTSHNRYEAERWLRASGANMDGVIGKRLDLPYDTGGHEAMVKVKNVRTADCVVAGFRYARKSKRVGSLLLGLFDDDHILHHVGYTSALSRDEFRKLTPRLERLARSKGLRGFTGRAPGKPSRWSTNRSAQFKSLSHRLVAEVNFDQVIGDRFRHGTTFIRWRPDKKPTQCRLTQLKAINKAAALFELGISVAGLNGSRDF